MKSALFFPPQLLFSLTVAPLAAATNHCTDVDIRRATAASALGSLFSKSTEDDSEPVGIVLPQMHNGVGGRQRSS